MRSFRWSASFSPEVEPRLTPVWVGFPSLRVHHQNPSPFKSIASVIGKFICTYDEVKNFTRLGYPRECVEIDLSLRIPEIVLIGNGKMKQSNKS